MKNIALALPTSNLLITGVGHDQNGNRVIKLKFDGGQRSFSIQTLSGLPRTNSTLRGLTNSDLSTLTANDLSTIENEVVTYVNNWGSEKQRKSLTVSN